MQDLLSSEICLRIFKEETPFFDLRIIVTHYVLLSRKGLAGHISVDRDILLTNKTSEMPRKYSYS